MPAAVTLTGGSAAFPFRDFLTRTNVEFEYLDDEGPPGIAVCRLADGTRLESPTLPELAARLGLLAEPSTDTYDLAVIGAGPAGLAAAVYAASEGLTTAVLEREAPGGQAGTSSRIENYLGFPDGVSGADLAERARAQALKFGADLLLLREVVAGGPEGALFRNELSDGTALVSRAVLCATGVTWRTLEAEGVDRLLQSGVYYGSAISEAPGVRGKDVVVIGGGNAAGQAAMNFSGVAQSVTLVVRGPGLAATMSRYLQQRLEGTPNVRIRPFSRVSAVDGDSWVRLVRLQDTRSGTQETVDTHAVFICIGGEPRTTWARAAGVAVDAGGYLLTGRDITDPELCDARWEPVRDPHPLETSRPGVFAAGDVRHGSTKRVSAAVGEGAMAVGLVHRYLTRDSA